MSSKSSSYCISHDLVARVEESVGVKARTESFGICFVKLHPFPVIDKQMFILHVY
jgi:hypothetical protein